MQEDAAKQREQDAQRKAIAEFRYLVIAPLLAGKGAHGDLTGRCRAFGLNRNTVRRWLEAYLKNETIEDLEPKAIRGNMLAELDLLKKALRSLETLH